MNTIIYSREYGYFAASFEQQHPNWRKGTMSCEDFPDGETRYQFRHEEIEGKDVILVSGITSSSSLIEAYFMACGIVEQGARSLAIVVPYLGWSTMDREVKSGEVVTSTWVARMLSAIPRACCGNQILLIDLHSDAILPAFDRDRIRPSHIYAQPVILETIRELVNKGLKRPRLACTDGGRLKWVQTFADELGFPPPAVVLKRRKSGISTSTYELLVDVQGEDIILYDDMIRTGGTSIGAARAYLERGANSVIAIATHGVFPGAAVKKLKDSRLFKGIIVSDTHPHALIAAKEFPDFVTVKSVGLLLARALRQE